MTVWDELKARGLIAQVTDEEEWRQSSTTSTASRNRWNVLSTSQTARH